MAPLLHRLSALGVFALTLLGCGEDAEQRYAGLDVISVTSDAGVGYRLRYLGPPWKAVNNDKLVTDDSVTFTLGDGTMAQQLTFEPDTARVLEIERESVVTDTPDGVVTFAKYRLEAMVVRCDKNSIPVASTSQCAEILASKDNAGRAGTDDLGFFGEGGRAGENDFGQPYHELMTRNRETRRYRRAVYFETADRQVAVRLFMEANPSLSETEVTRMVDAFEIVEATGSAGGQP